MKRWTFLVVALSALVFADCNCGRNARITMVPDGGHPYDRVLPASSLAAGATQSRSEHFQLVGDVTAPAGSSSTSEHFQLRDGVVGASQE